MGLWQWILVNTIDTKRILYDYILNKIEKSNLIKIAAASLKFLGPEGLLKLNLTEPWPPETLRQSITLLRLCKYLQFNYITICHQPPTFHQKSQKHLKNREPISNEKSVSTIRKLQIKINKFPPVILNNERNVWIFEIKVLSTN